MKLLLDTCTFLWLAEGSRKLGAAAIDAFLNEDNERYVSAASAWEIAVKYSRGRMPLPSRPEIYVPQLRLRGDIEMLPVGEEAALYVGKLPWLHQDPFDRVLIAQAVVNGMTILTPDADIEQYAVRTLW